MLLRTPHPCTGCWRTTLLVSLCLLSAVHAESPLHQNPLDDMLDTIFSKSARKDPAISVLLAAAPPLLSVQGLGQIYNGDVGKGLFFFGIGQVSIGTWQTAVDDKTANIALAVYMASWAWTTIDAYRSAKRINRQRGHAAYRPRVGLHRTSVDP